MLLNKIFSDVDKCLSCEDIARQICAMVPGWRLFGDFLGLVLSAQHVSDLHLKFALKGHTMCGSMVDIQSATAEIRRGKKEEKRKKERNHRAKYNGLPYNIGRPSAKRARL